RGGGEDASRVAVGSRGHNGRPYDRNGAWPWRNEGAAGRNGHFYLPWISVSRNRRAADEFSFAAHQLAAIGRCVRGQGTGVGCLSPCGGAALQVLFLWRLHAGGISAAALLDTFDPAVPQMHAPLGNRGGFGAVGGQKQCGAKTGCTFPKQRQHLITA